MGRAKNSLTRESVSSTPIKFRYSVTYDSASLATYGITTGSGINYPYNVNMSAQQMEDMNRYRVVRQLYYQQAMSSSANTASFWDPFWQSTAASGTNDSTVYNFPTAYTSSVIVFAIPSSQFGENLSRKSFLLSSSAYYILDDGNGNLIDYKNSKAKVGNIFYAQGIAVITNQNYADPNAEPLVDYIVTQAYEPVITQITENIII